MQPQRVVRRMKGMMYIDLLAQCYLVTVCKC